MGGGVFKRRAAEKDAARPPGDHCVHGSKQRILTECTPEEQAEEIFASKQVLEKLLGQTCDLFAYSHGQYDDNIRKLTAFAGYRKAFAVAAGR